MTYKVLPNSWVKFDNWLKNSAGPPGAPALSMKASMIREKFVATCWRAVNA